MAMLSIYFSIALAIPIGSVGALKITRAPSALREATRLGYAVRAYQAIGALEVAGACGLIVGLFRPPLGAAAAIGLVALLTGAVLSLRRVGDGLRQAVPAIWVGLLSALTAVFTIVAR